MAARFFSLVIAGAGTVQFGLLLVFSLPAAKLLAPSIDTGQLGLDRVVRFAQLLDLFLNYHYPLIAVQGWI